MTAQSIRFVYTDSNGDQQIVASTLGQGAEINRVRQNRNFRDTNKVKVWGGSKMFNAFPQQINEFQGPEPEIFMEERVNGSFETVARVYSKGSGDIKDKESVCVTLYGFQRYVEEQQVSISNTTTDIVDVAEKLANELDGSYVIDAPAEADVSGGYPSVDGYSYSGKADRVIQELTRDYNFNLLFTDRTDNNGNNVIRFEPEGFGGAVDTLDSNTTGLVFDNWEKERTENIVNKVEVEAVNSNGNNVTGTASNQDMINKYGVKFERVQLQFVESQSEADLIAEERLKPGKDGNGNDITTPPEGGVVNLPTDTFRQGIENDSVNVVDNELNIDDTFTVSKHKLFYPSGRSELHLDFEDEKLEKRAAKDKYLGDRNSELITSESKNATGSTGETGPKTSGEVGETGPSTSGEVGETGPSTSGQVGDTGPKTAGLVGRGGPTKLVEDAVDTNTFSNGLGTFFQELGKVSQAPVGSNGSSGVVVYVTATNNASVSGTASLVIELGLTVESTEFATVGTNYPTMNYFITDGDAGGSATLWIPAEISENDTVKLNGRTKSGNTGAVEFDVTFAFVEKHQHGADPDNSDGATIDVDLHGHNADSDDDTVSIDVDLHGHNADSDDSDTTIDVDLHGHNADSDDSDTTIDVDKHNHDGSSLDVEVDVEDQVNR